MVINQYRALSLAVLFISALASCSKPASQPLSATPEFQTQALTVPYLGRKINRWLNSSPSQLVQELEYARLKHPQLGRDMVAQASAPTALYTQIANQPEILAYGALSPDFASYIQSLNPTPQPEIVVEPSTTASIASGTPALRTLQSPEFSAFRFGQLGKTSGKWYFEVKVDLWSSSSKGMRLGVSNANFSRWWTWNNEGLRLFSEVSQSGNYGSDVWSTGTVVGVLVDLDAHTLSYRVNNNPQGNFAYSNLTGTVYPYFVFGINGDQATFRFSQSHFSYAIPAGYAALM